MQPECAAAASDFITPCTSLALLTSSEREFGPGSESAGLLRLHGEKKAKSDESMCSDNESQQPNARESRYQVKRQTRGTRTGRIEAADVYSGKEGMIWTWHGRLHKVP